MRSHCDSKVIDNIIVDTSNHSNICGYIFTKILDTQLLSPLTKLLHPIMVYFMICCLLLLEWTLPRWRNYYYMKTWNNWWNKFEKNRQNTLITLHHDIEEINQVLYTMKCWISLHDIHTLNNCHPVNVCNIPDTFQMSWSVSNYSHRMDYTE